MERERVSLSQAELLAALHQRVGEAGGRAALAQRLGVSDSTVYEAVASGRVKTFLAKAMGYEPAFIEVRRKERAYSSTNLDPRYIAGCSLVTRMGTLGDVSSMEGRRAEVQEINRLTQVWLAEQQRRTA